jgi:predicted ArsR family transcriptional regulator
VNALADALTNDGFAATVVQEGVGAGIQICQHNCPVAHVAAQFPILCEQEAKAMQRILGANVTRLATIAHGDGVCTSIVTKQQIAAQEPPDVVTGQSSNQPSSTRQSVGDQALSDAGSR